VLGQSAPNPHDARIIRALAPTLAQESEMTRALDAAELARIAATDGQALSAITIRRWEEVLLSPDQPSPLLCSFRAQRSLRAAVRAATMPAGSARDPA
jgi:hypothetical protein